MTTIYTTSETVANAIIARLAEISIVNGFETDIGLKIQHGRRRIPADDEPPLIQLVEGNDTIEDTAGRITMAQVKLEQHYVIDAFDRCDPDNPNVQAHKMIRDIKKVIFRDGRTLGGTVAEVKYMGKDIGPRPDGAALVQARVMIAVCFSEDLGNP